MGVFIAAHPCSVALALKAHVPPPPARHPSGLGSSDTSSGRWLILLSTGQRSPGVSHAYLAFATFWTFVSYPSIWRVFVCFERECTCERAGERGSGRERVLSRLSVEPTVGLNPTTLHPDLSPNRESDAQPTGPPTLPRGAMLSSHLDRKVPKV